MLTEQWEQCVAQSRKCKNVDKNWSSEAWMRGIKLKVLLRMWTNAEGKTYRPDWSVSMAGQNKLVGSWIMPMTEESGEKNAYRLKIRVQPEVRQSCICCPQDAAKIGQAVKSI